MKEKALLIDIPYGEDTLSLYIPQPSFDRVGLCIDLFGYLFDNIKKYKNILRLAKDLDFIVKKVSTQENDPNLKNNLDALFQDAILGIKPLNKHDGKDLLGGQALYDALSDDTKAMLKAQFVFQYALLHYATQEMKEAGLSEFCTALSFEEYRKHFLKSTEAVEKQSLKHKKQKG